MNTDIRGCTALAGVLLVAAVVLIIAPSETVGQPGPDDETCLECHDGHDASLAVGPHRLSSQIQRPAAKIACASCHAGGNAHIEDPSEENISNPAKLVAAEAINTCTACHQPHLHMGNFGFDPHLGSELVCTSCHSVHSGGEKLLLDDNAEFCGSCHVNIISRFQSRSNHPLPDGNVTCLSCHEFGASLEPDFGHGSSANCYRCHPEQSGPYLYEHEATSSFSTEGEGCVACHDPHGSPNERLLRQPDDNLCRQCHGVPGRHRIAHEGIGAAFGCLECHTSVHGSYDQRNLLDPNLGTNFGDGPGSCWCHNVDN